MEGTETTESSVVIERVATGKICPVCGEQVRTRLPYDWERGEEVTGEFIVEHFAGDDWCLGAGKQIH